jgi:hypothetical protein
MEHTQGSILGAHSHSTLKERPISDQKNKKNFILETNGKTIISCIYPFTEPCQHIQNKVCIYCICSCTYPTVHTRIIILFPFLFPFSPPLIPFFFHPSFLPFLLPFSLFMLYLFLFLSSFILPSLPFLLPFPFSCCTPLLFLLIFPSFPPIPPSFFRPFTF